MPPLIAFLPSNTACLLKVRWSKIDVVMVGRLVKEQTYIQIDRRTEQPTSKLANKTTDRVKELMIELKTEI